MSQFSLALSCHLNYVIFPFNCSEFNIFCLENADTVVFKVPIHGTCWLWTVLRTSTNNLFKMVIRKNCSSWALTTYLVWGGLFFLYSLYRNWHMDIRPKKVVLLMEIGRVKISYLSPDCIVECVSEYMFLCIFKFKKKNKETKNSKRN